jgi:hypothetical protein
MIIEMFIWKFMENKIKKNIKNSIKGFWGRVKSNNNKNIYCTIRRILRAKIYRKIKKSFLCIFSFVKLSNKKSKKSIKSSKKFLNIYLFTAK